MERWGRAAPGSDRVEPDQDRDQDRDPLDRDPLDRVSVPLGRPGRSSGLVFCRQNHAFLQCEQIFGELRLVRVEWNEPLLESNGELV